MAIAPDLPPRTVVLTFNPASGKEYSMSRGNQQNIKGMYLNVIRVSESLDSEFQRRVHHVAKTTKDEDLASALARRPDTLDEIDDDLGSWGSAKVQSAWFSRPGRDIAAAAKRLSKEKRVTVLEVIAALPGLDPSIYEICARRDAPRVALHLVGNESAPLECRILAVKSIAKGYSGLSYARQGALMASLASCDPQVADAFVCGADSLTTVSRAMSAVSSLSMEATDSVLSLCVKRMRDAKKQHAQAVVEDSNNKTGYRSWNSAAYELNTAVREVMEATKALAMVGNENADREAALETVQALIDICAEGKLGQSDKDLTSILNKIKDSVAWNSVAEQPTSPASYIKAASGPEAVLQILTEANSGNRLDRSTAMAALLSPHANEDIARAASRAFGWGEAIKILETKHRELSTPVKVVLLAASYAPNDKHIRQFSSNTTPVEFWTEMVTYYAKHGSIPPELLQSQFAQVEVVPKLPLRIFSQTDMPGWLITAFSEYLSKELTTQAAWDGFEVLAPKHLGDVAQVVRAAKLSTKHHSAQ